MSPRAQEFYFWNSTIIMMVHGGRRPPLVSPNSELSSVPTASTAIGHTHITCTGTLPLQALTTGTRTPSPAPFLGELGPTAPLSSPSPSRPHSTSSYLPELQQRRGQALLYEGEISEKWLVKTSRIQTPVPHHLSPIKKPNVYFHRPSLSKVQ